MVSVKMVNGQISINGQNFTGSNVVIEDDNIIIDGKTQGSVSNAKKIEISIIGNVENLKVENGNVSVQGDVTGKLDVGGNLEVNKGVVGNIDAGGNATIGGYVEGDIDAGGNVNVGGNASGDIDAGGNVICQSRR